MTKLLIVGDTHGNMDWVVNQVIPHAVSQGVDKIMQLGDHGFVWPRPNYLGGLDKLNRVLDRDNLDMHFLSGNHEDHTKLELLSKRARERSPEGHFQLRSRLFYTGRVAAWEWNGWRCAAVGGATSIDRKFRTPGKSWWPQEVLSPEDVALAKSIGPVDILFSHDAPTQNPFHLKLDEDSLAHRQVVTDVARSLQPDNWFHGHYHRYARYSFNHARGYADVIGLNCDGTPLMGSTVVLDLSASPV